MANSSVSSSLVARPVLPIDQVPSMVFAVGEQIPILLQGEPGVGKTSILVTIAKLVGDKWRKPGDFYPDDKYDYILIPAAQLDVAAFGMAMPVVETKTIEVFIGGLLRPQDPRPKVIVIDELAKAQRILMPPLRTLMLERCAFDHRLPEGSIVVATTNNPADGLGDVIKAHEGNAMCIVQTTKSTLPGWLAYAVEAGVSPITCATVSMHPRMFDSYITHDVSQNPYVFDPTKRALSYVSPRSLVKNDFAFVQRRHLLTREQLFAGMAGTIGQAAAQAFMAMFDVEKEVFTAADVIKDPQGTPVPASMAAKLFMLFQSYSHLTTQDALARYMEYVLRWGHNELEGVFAHGAHNHPATKTFAHRNPKLNEWKKHELNFETLQVL